LNHPEYVSRSLAVDDTHLVAGSGHYYLANDSSDTVVLFSVPAGGESASATYRSAARIAGTDEVTDIAIAGGWAYLSTWSGLATIDLTAATPSAVLTPGSDHYSIAVAPGRAYAALDVRDAGGANLGGGIRTYDIGNPASPALVQERVLAPNSEIDAVLVYGEYLIALLPDYRAEGKNVIVVNRADLSVVSSLDIPGFDALDGVIDGTTLYVSGDYYVRDAIAVVDLSDVSDPRVVSFIDTPGFATGIAVSGPDEIVVADGAVGVTFVNVANKLNPIILGSQDTPGNAVDVKVIGRTIYVATEQHLHTILRP
jgi:hypothetical protein